MALPKDERLKKGGDFRSVFRNQKGAKTKNLVMKARPTDKASPRFGIVISKQVSKKAVERNRMRRLLQEAIVKEQGSLPSPHDIVLVALPGFSVPDVKGAQELVAELFEKTFPKKPS